MKLSPLPLLLAVVCVNGRLDLEINEKHHAALGACQACKAVVKSFKAAMEKTARGYHEGGDTDWEEKKLKNYAHSEVRLAEIQSMLCTDIVVGKSQCHDVANDAEEAIETEWWPAEPRPDLHLWLCVERRRVCCPAGHYGPTCQPCPGGPDTPCSGHGHCKGDGSRKGSGACACNKGYSGTLCNACNVTDHYEAYKDDNKLVCSPCHKSCDGACAGAGPKHCVRCASGYQWESEYGCSDINECLKPDTCRTNQLCINDPGKYTCMDCDRACATCHGDGPDMCHECATGYVKKGKLCVDEAKADEYDDDEESNEEETSGDLNPPENEDLASDSANAEQVSDEQPSTESTDDAVPSEAESATSHTEL
ncbi:cysteine-rich with EGF-like domain protein 2 isoform X3 [Amphibalanus amphitrite]|nr:cysteine-rich with EGF-like domain protein 2 isoform X3 [Amphibalanus amphitrite]XP_043212563.1 cysteine-rich with EGF-like domain protein 2 isoform X3 [Amphibalanus amphitrite]XP_043212566.1 cysteine-rich with EGF-like domain protein 2 isoform X3 [Amphibalanus amphitrite]XP_043212567.1 cysteine-rich with EGF-like domain protein 2 isoform X3 [Amphibalanus amphitrite]XP_043212568.1 cysteine-rich with EGF-like domain protein 2 isoform X3 [Amphibalanus amphitrite]